MEIQTIKAKTGIWTPWAQVLCMDCHGTIVDNKGMLSEGTLKTYNELRPLQEFNTITTCDKCKCEIQMDDGIAEEHNIVLALQALGFKANMDQTGGMCSAASVDLDTGKTYDFETQTPWMYISYNADGNHKYTSSMYDEHGEWIEDECAQTDTWEEMLEYLKTKPLKKLEDK